MRSNGPRGAGDDMRNPLVHKLSSLMPAKGLSTKASLLKRTTLVLQVNHFPQWNASFYLADG